MKELETFVIGFCSGMVVIAIALVLNEYTNIKSRREIILYKRPDTENSMMYYVDEKTNTQYTLNNGILEVRALKGE